MNTIFVFVILFCCAFATQKTINPSDDVSAQIFCSAPQSCSALPHGTASANEVSQFCFYNGFYVCGNGFLYSRFDMSVIPSTATIDSVAFTEYCCNSSGSAKTCPGHTIVVSSMSNDGQVWSETNVQVCPETAGCTVAILSLSATQLVSVTEGTNSMVASTGLTTLAQNAVQVSGSMTLLVGYPFHSSYLPEYYCSTNNANTNLKPSILVTYH